MKLYLMPLIFITSTSLTAMEEVRDAMLIDTEVSTTNNFEAMQQAALEEINSGYYGNLTSSLLPFFSNATSSSLSGGRQDLIISLITIAVEHDHKNIVRFLKYFGVLERHLFFYLRLHGTATLHFPACPIELVYLLVRAGADVNYHESFNTPIVAAINMGPRNSERTLKLLGLFINAGADVNQISAHTTPLEFAILNNKDLTVVKYLLFHGADTDLPTKGHILRRACGSFSNNTEIIEFLLNLPETDINYVNQAAYNQATGWVDHGSCIPLFAAVLSNRQERVQFLLEHGADIDITDPLGWTALMLASWRALPDMVKLLLEKNADTTLEDSDGNTALDITRLEREDDESNKSIIQIIKLLKAKE
jgi:ankyrin repeat protein